MSCPAAVGLPLNLPPVPRFKSITKEKNIVYMSRVCDFGLRDDISVVFTIYFLAATSFIRTTIFRWKYVQWKLIRLTTDPLFF
jgi:hypothetical protein